jgi:hypothetical protein
MAPADIILNILSNAHGHILAGHDGILKTKERILQSYYWPGMDQDIQLHIQKCHQCQLRKPSRLPPPLMSLLLQCSAPNQQIHSDLFGPLKTSESSKKFILFTTSTEPPKMISSEQIPETVNKSVFPPLPVQPPSPVKRRQGQPPGPRPPNPPPQISKNDGGICTRSQTAKQRAMKNDLNINSLKYNHLP